MKSKRGKILETFEVLIIILGIIGSLITGVIYMVSIEPIVGLVIIIVGSGASIIYGTLLGALGELLDTTSNIAYILNPTHPKEEKISEIKKEEKKQPKNEEDLVEEQVVITEQQASDGKWICPECYREIDDKVDTCKCGYEKKL